MSDWASALSWGRDEAELVTELQSGSETAFDWLVTHYHGPVYNLILGMLGDTADAENQIVDRAALLRLGSIASPSAKL